MSRTTTEHEIRLATEDDDAAVQRLVAQMWGGDVSERFAWLYKANPHGKALTWLAVERSSGDAVACTSIFPRSVTVDGTRRMGSIGGDCYVEPRARRRGLSTAMHRASLAGMRAAGVDFMYGPPNPNNLASLLKAGSNLVTTFRRFVRPLVISEVVSAAIKMRPPAVVDRVLGPAVRLLDRVFAVEISGATLTPVTEFDARFDQLTARQGKQHPIACGRDRAYLTWRYLAAPARKQLPYAVERSGELVGFVVLEPIADTVTVVDLIANDRETVDVTLSLVIAASHAARRRRIEFDCTAGSHVAARLPRAGFVSRQDRGFQVFLAAAELPQTTLLNPAAWHFTEGDKDTDTSTTAMPE